MGYCYGYINSQVWQRHRNFQNIYFNCLAINNLKHMGPVIFFFWGGHTFFAHFAQSRIHARIPLALKTSRGGGGGGVTHSLFHYPRALNFIFFYSCIMVGVDLLVISLNNIFWQAKKEEKKCSLKSFPELFLN